MFEIAGAILAPDVSGKCANLPAGITFSVLGCGSSEFNLLTSMVISIPE